MPSCSSPESLAAAVATVLLACARVGAALYGARARRKRL